jgi:hypothetical protein
LKSADECNSFRNFHHFRKRLLPFCQFCHLLANDLIVDVVSPFAYDSEDPEEGNQTTSNNKEAGKDLFSSYKNQSAYFSNRHLIVKRKNQRLFHVPCTRGKQVSCIWCCRCNECHINGTKHSRHERKTSWVCVTCQRNDGKSCFALFHEADELFNQLYCFTGRTSGKNAMPWQAT